MKAFEKWYDSNATSCDPQTANEEGWEAALKWALSHKKPISYNKYKFDYIKTDIIEDELKETE